MVYDETWCHYSGQKVTQLQAALYEEPAAVSTAASIHLTDNQAYGHINWCCCRYCSSYQSPSGPTSGCGSGLLWHVRVGLVYVMANSWYEHQSHLCEQKLRV